MKYTLENFRELVKKVLSEGYKIQTYNSSTVRLDADVNVCHLGEGMSNEQAYTVLENWYTERQQKEWISVLEETRQWLDVVSGRSSTKDSN